MSEFGFIDTIRNMFASMPSNGFEGIGDDCAVFSFGNGEALVFTTDLLAEDIHFLRRATSPFLLGRKSLAVNLSDVAAMGARPVASMLSLALPRELTGEWADEFMRGYHDMSQHYGVQLVGGDTTLSQSGFTVNVVAIGRVPEGNIKRRSDAREGDVVMVGGRLGASAEGLNDILHGNFDTAYAMQHKNPEPQVAEGFWLGKRAEVHAMMDLSDGVASDLVHILEASHVGAVVETEHVPAVTSVERAVCGGEDYKLLFTVEPEAAERLMSEYAAEFGSRPFAIGRIVASSDPVIEWRENGHAFNPDWHGFSHY